MATTQFNFNALFQGMFGFAPGNVKFDNPDQKATTRASGDESGNIKFTSQNLTGEKSEAGMYGSYYARDVRGRWVFMPLRLGGLMLPYVWLNVRADKRIIETPMTERRGSVIELIGYDNIKIGVKGLPMKNNTTLVTVRGLKKVANTKHKTVCQHCT